MLKRARHDTRAWVVKRRERTRQLIELGGLIAKAGLVALAEDDRAVILGLLTEAAAKLRGEDRERQLTLWRRRGKRAFVFEEMAVEASSLTVHPHFRGVTARPRSGAPSVVSPPDSR